MLLHFVGAALEIFLLVITVTPRINNKSKRQSKSFASLRVFDFIDLRPVSELVYAATLLMNCHPER